MTVCRSLTYVLFVVLASVAAVGAQTASGTISGSVRDETGAVLPGATVLVTNADTSQTRTLVTDASGRYSAPDLAPGPYEVKASLSGFAPIVRSGIRLTVGRDAVVDFALKLGAISDQVTVV